MRRIIVALLAALALVAAAPAAAEANTAGHACNHLRYGGSQNTAVYFNDLRWGAWQWSWAQVGTPTGFQVNQSGVRSDGSGWCRGSWYAYRTANANDRQRCQFYANSSASYVITKSTWEQCLNY
jgi:hypothetical protein